MFWYFWKLCNVCHHILCGRAVVSLKTEVGRNTWRFGNTAVSGTAGVGNLSLSALLARLKAFQLPWSASLYSIGLSLWRCISETMILSLWLSGYSVGTSIFIRATVSLVAILCCCGWETAEIQCLPQNENVQEEILHLELLRTSNDCVRLLSEVHRLRVCADNNGRHFTDTAFREWGEVKWQHVALRHAATSPNI